MDLIIVILIAAIPFVVGGILLFDKYKSSSKPNDNTLYIEALQALLNGDDRRAFAKFREVVTADSDNIDAYLRIGSIFRSNQKADLALQVDRDLIRRHNLSKNQKITIYRAMTDDYLLMDDYPAASRSLQDYLTLNDSDSWGLRTKLRILEGSEKWEEALVVREALLKVEGDLSRKPLASYKVRIGQGLLKDGKGHPARLAFKEALTLDEPNVAAHLAIGDSYLHEDRPHDAIEARKRLVNSAPEHSGPALERLERAVYEIGNFGEIENICRRALELDPGNLPANLKLATYFAKKSDYSAAEERLRQALDDNPDSSLPVLELARIYLLTKEEKKILSLIGMLERKEEEKSDSEVSVSAGGGS